MSVSKALRTLLRPAARRAASLPWVTALGRSRFARQHADHPGELALVERISTRISPDDEMYRGDLGHYYSVGLSAIRCLEDALREAGARDPGTILDIPCGHGRVMRYLAARFPQARITGCEIDPGALDFCARELGAATVPSRRDLRELALPGSYDLIWCGSLLTHLDESTSMNLLDLLARHMAPGGVLVFTTHGELVVRRILEHPASYRLSSGEQPRILERYRDTGHAYWGHPERPDHGVSITSDAWVRAHVARLPIPLHEVYFRPNGWDGHQDVYAYLRSRDA